ncbi:3-deoxy-D-arabinoheptulosonate-7-phosphate synthase [Isosphaera pallida ATCC 43644]|uniref:3-deoxy-D-arabinoheptulosonate-7-phosphate synthase n=1 Tax=Isosphaera pallida (strain ATCC 43644 / DSM 9630 / IS1B) TaxID=575540 RepID=E8QWX1_ISOPI|nr:3-deoxy-7-phosphoheptulonate synthase [Isosphaera pallida]ADV64010.1 3-deoxy-D-arabinoheptulosonate-7-phosphate synthase [Isosphaera pallida ATCC 43644]
MLIVMQAQASSEQIDRVLETVRRMGLTPHPLPGPTRTAIGVTGNTAAVDRRPLEMLPGVEELIRVTKPFKLASREMKPHDTAFRVGPNQGARIGPGSFTLIAGPCSVESRDLILGVAEAMTQRGVKLMRAGAFKPRTSPYAFQGMGEEGLRILEEARAATGIGIVTELMDTQDAQAVAQVADMIQIGARNMQNFALLKCVARLNKPVLLKRGLAATLEEWLMAAEYILSGPNYNVALCERGVRTFSDHSRNTLDLSVIPPLKAVSHLPVLVDPSHGTGKRAFVPAMARAALAAGADGLLIEVHPHPEKALSDGPQSIDYQEFDALLESLRKLAPHLGVELT